MRRELEPAALPVRDGVPFDVPERVPGVADIPCVVATDEVGHEERDGREPEVGENRIGIPRERGVPVVKREEEGAWPPPPPGDGRSVWLESMGELSEGERPPPRFRERGHLAVEDGPAHAGDAELE